MKSPFLVMYATKIFLRKMF
ncbi:unnamed protein product [Larinioides sclopetarius]|uniref:Uncharacterized protein n=1 Tax=Larinioides sclopetarius TaxID=280406 RepID=A0AAV2BQI4_9ARAC